MIRKKVSEFRKKAENLIYTTHNLIDRSGKTTSEYKKFFSSMSDEQFVKYIKGVITDKEFPYFPATITPFDKKSEPTLDSFIKCAKFLGIELDEYVVLKYLTEECPTKTAPVTKIKVPVGLLHLKVLQQIIRKKNKITSSNEVRDQRTGQVRGDDKGGRITDADAYALTAINAYPVMKELYGPRADSVEQKEKFYAKIREGNKHPRLSDIPSSPADKVALNTLNEYFMGAGLMTDLVNPSYLLEDTVKDTVKGKNKED